MGYYIIKSDTEKGPYKAGQIRDRLRKSLALLVCTGILPACAHAPKANGHEQPTSLSRGSIPAPEIQRVVRPKFVKFAHCYEIGLHQNPDLKGYVTVRLVIGLDGHVVQAFEDRTELPPLVKQSALPRMADARVVSCVVDAFKGLIFPEPVGGTATMVYPILLSPSDG